jgi:hypothetical protein
VRVLFDQGTPAPLANHLSAHYVSTAYELGWGDLKNGELLQQAEDGGFEVPVTTDQNLKYQQILRQAHADRTRGPTRSSRPVSPHPKKTERRIDNRQYR